MKVSKEIKDLVDSFDIEQIKMGINVEREHNEGETDIINSNLDLLKVALAHLKEDPKYYTKLKQVEEDLVSSDNQVVGPANLRVPVSHAKGLNEESSSKIKAEYKAFKKLPRKSLEAEYKRRFKISTPAGGSKDELVTDIIRSIYGDKAVAKAFGLKESKSYVLEEGTGLLTELPYITVGKKTIDLEFEKGKGVQTVYNILMGKVHKDKHGNKFKLNTIQDLAEFAKVLRNNSQAKKLIKEVANPEADDKTLKTGLKKLGFKDVKKSNDNYDWEMSNQHGDTVAVYSESQTSRIILWQISDGKGHTKSGAADDLNGRNIKAVLKRFKDAR